MRSNKIIRRMYYIRYTAFLLLFVIFPFEGMSVSSDTNSEGIDVKEVVLGHMSDGYSWHVTTLGHHHVSIPLPVILWSENSGWHIFSSACFHKTENGEYQGFFLNPDKNGKIYEKDELGNITKPIDLSITKNVVQIWIVVVLMLLIFIGSAKWYRNKKQGDFAPKGFVGLVEMFVMMVHDDIIKASIGEKHYRPFVPYLLTVFFFIFITNLMGLIPFFPGGANVTGNITVTFFLALCTLLIVNLSGNKEYWKEIFWPAVPVWLKVPIPMMPAIELFGIFTKPFALMVRLFANIMGGHAIILSLTCVIFITCQIGATVGTPLTIVSFLLMIFMDCLELLVAFIQAYVFTMLSAVFIGLSHPEIHE